jgi:hypothetical protein
MSSSSYSTWLPSLIILAGWFVVSRQHDGRERRKELQQLQKDIRSSLAEVIKTARSLDKMHGSYPDCKAVRFQLSSSVNLVLNDIDQFEKASKSAAGVLTNFMGNGLDWDSVSASIKPHKNEFMAELTGDWIHSEDRASYTHALMVDAAERSGNAIATTLLNSHFKNF